MRELLIINNIPTPYRTFMFNKIYNKGLELGIETTVAFQARREARRTWRPEDFDLQCPHYFSTGLNPMRKREKEWFTYRTINTDIIIELMRGKYDWVLMSPIMSINSWIASLLPLKKTKKVLWSEDNASSSRHKSFFARRVKRILHGRYMALACPGERAIAHILSFAPQMRDKPVLSLPNIADSLVYGDECKAYQRDRTGIRNELGVSGNSILVLGIGRMEHRKGFGLLISAANKVEGEFKIVLLGDGPIRPLLLQNIEDLGLHAKVLLLGDCDQSRVVRYLSAADWFVHPSLADTGPLVTIEAAFAGLPLAVSKQTGNSPEVIEDNVNGFTFDPSDANQMASCLVRMLNTSNDERREMGKASERLARGRFDAEAIVERFLRGLMGL